MRHLTSIFLVVVVIVLVAVLTGCGGGGGGTSQDAYGFCGSHGGVNESTWEDDGDVECGDGTEYEGDGDIAGAGYFKKHKKTNFPSGKKYVVKKNNTGNNTSKSTSKNSSNYSKPKSNSSSSTRRYK